MTNIRTSDPLGVNEMLYQLKRPRMETPRFYGHSPKAQKGGWRNKGEPEWRRADTRVPNYSRTAERAFLGR